jgi:hypothetical protein
MLNFLNPPVTKKFLGYTGQAISYNTVKEMIKIIYSSSANPYVRKFAERIIRDIKDRDEMGEIQAVYDFMINHIKYVHDPLGIEFIQTPPYILNQMELGDIPALDCDDYTVLSLSLLRSIGYNVAIRLAAYHEKENFEHVYGLVFLEQAKKWIVFDGIRKDKWLGWEAPNALSISDFEV